MVNKTVFSTNSISKRRFHRTIFCAGSTRFWTWVGCAAHRWFCRLGLEDPVPDHATFSVNRHGRFRASDILRKVFEEVVWGCLTAGLAGDVAYGAGETPGWLVARNIDPHIPVWGRSAVAPEGKFTRAEFAYDKERDLYICPGGKALKTSGAVHDGVTIEYIAKAQRPCLSVRSSPNAPRAGSAGSSAMSIRKPATTLNR